MSKLTALDIERVDAVDRPATGRRFILAKSDPTASATAAGTTSASTTATETRVEDAAAPLAEAVRAVIAAFDGADNLTPAQRQALAVLMAALGTGATDQTARKDASAGRADATDADVAKDADGAAAAGTEVEVAVASPPSALTAETLAQAITAAIGPRFDALTEALTARGVIKSAPPASRQTARPEATSVAKDAAPKLGDGLFADVVFGQS